MLRRELKEEDEIKKDLPNVYDIVVHIEPLGNAERERFGLREKDVEDYEK